MIIIVEGPDGAGKSELIEQLLKSHPGSTSIHFTNPKTPAEAANYWKVYANAILSTDPNKVTLFDRSWYSDAVYGPIFRDKIEMDPLHIKMLESLVVTNGGGHVVYCTAPLNTLWSRCQKRGETFVLSKDKLAAVLTSYNALFDKSCGLPVIKFDTKD